MNRVAMNWTRPRAIRAVKPRWWMRGRVVTLLSIALLAALATSFYWYWYSTSSSENKLEARVDFAVKLLFGSAAIVSMLVGYQSLRQNIYRAQVEGAFELLARFDTPEEREARDTLDELFRQFGELVCLETEMISEQQIDGFAKVIDEKEKPERRKACRAAMAFYEDVALAIVSGYADESVLWASLGPSTVYYLTALRPYVLDLRRKTSDPAYFSDSDRLLASWRNKQCLYSISS